MGISLFLVRNSLLWSEKGGKRDGLISGDCKKISPQHIARAVFVVNRSEVLH